MSSKNLKVPIPAKRLCAHRGLSAALPENSLPALVSAAALGADVINSNPPS